MKILVFGKTGQVATELQRSADVTALGRDQADLQNPEACARIISETDADIIINAAAYTAVDKAETDQETAQLVNGDSPTAMAKAAAKRNIPFLHISTDYVFDGSGTAPRDANSATNPLNVYGRTKLSGEQGVAAAGGKYAILRTSWVFSAHGANFVKTMLRLGKERDALNIVNDQIGGPTPAAGIASAMLSMGKSFHEGTGKNGIYHYTGTPNASWEDFAREIFLQSGISVELGGIATADYPTPALRPLNSRLNCVSLKEVFGISQPDWRIALRDVLLELGELK